MKKTIDINDLLDSCKTALNARSDYHLAQMLELHKARISEFRSGKGIPDVYACTRIAMALEKDPLEIIAMVEGGTAKSETQREFWRTFKFSGMRNSLGVLLCGTLGFSGLGLPGGWQTRRFIALLRSVHVSMTR